MDCLAIVAELGRRGNHRMPLGRNPHLQGVVYTIYPPGEGRGHLALHIDHVEKFPQSVKQTVAASPMLSLLRLSLL